ncbi:MULTISPECIES: PCYCGC motif-containing (lipo)protein [Cohnella]|uniref:PCYCGC motif-containing (lipo)protein n=1 Tax=Cohnella TaxID=329857 RepID=UPI0009BA732A|nr:MULTISPECIES: PCYCGC motif-containing (lipo)protein [Cohnella]MBN2984874.1 hypothetical protein [Cohnella algarum]
MTNRSTEDAFKAGKRALPLYALLMAGVFALLLAACGGGGESQGSAPASEHDHAEHAAKTENGDLREETASLADMPSFLDGQGAQVKLSYTAAAKLRDTLQYMPCYCGCGESAGHKSNLDCFIAAVREDGTVLWDDHGTRCGVCQQIALQAAKLKSEGAADAEIRRFVDETYGQGLGKATDTPLPPSA